MYSSGKACSECQIRQQAEDSVGNEIADPGATRTQLAQDDSHDRSVFGAGREYICARGSSK